MSKKTVIELCMSPDLGGLELYMVRAAKALSSEFHLLSVINTKTKLDSYFDNTQEYIQIDKSSNFFMFSAAKKLANIIDKENVEIIHMHWTKDIPFVILAKLLSKKRPKIVQTRHMTMTRFKNDFYHKFLYKHIDLILSVTQQVKEQLERFIPQEIRPRVEVLYLGADSSKLLDAKGVDALKSKLAFKQGSFNLGMVGRINEAKGQHLLIQALSNIKDDNVHAYFVGQEMREGYVEELKSLAKELGLQKRVHFLGFMKNPHHFYQICDAVVLASKRETFGLVLIEAMQVSTAVIGSNSGGVVEIIDDEETGLLFEAQNASSLGSAIEKLMKDRALLERIANAGEAKCEEKFSNEKQFKKLANILTRELSC